MAQNIFVKARNKETGTETVITYKAYLDIQSLLDLVGQSDEHGILIPGDPNLQPAHRRPAEKSGATVDNIHFNGITITEKALQDMKDAEKFASDNSPSPSFPYIPIISDQVSTNAESTPPISSEVNESASDPFHVEQPAPASEHIKERKKPGPKPKIKQNEV